MARGKSKTLNQTSAVLACLKRGNRLSAADGFHVVGTTHLASIVYHLRKKGWVIENEYHEGVNRFGGKCHWVAYKLADINQEVDNDNSKQN